MSCRTGPEPNTKTYSDKAYFILFEYPLASYLGALHSYDTAARQKANVLSFTFLVMSLKCELYKTNGVLCTGQKIIEFKSGLGLQESVILQL